MTKQVGKGKRNDEVGLELEVGRGVLFLVWGLFCFLFFLSIKLKSNVVTCFKFKHIEPSSQYLRTVRETWKNMWV